MSKTKAFSCHPPFERYGAIIKFNETASKARYQALLDLYDIGFRERQVKIMDIDVYREQALDDFPEVEDMSIKEAYRKRVELKESEYLKEVENTP